VEGVPDDQLKWLPRMRRVGKIIYEGPKMENPGADTRWTGVGAEGGEKGTGGRKRPAKRGHRDCAPGENPSEKFS